MKYYQTLLVALVSIMVSPNAPGQAFLNLDMEQVTTNRVAFLDLGPPLPRNMGEGPVEDLLPGWEVLFNGQPQARLGFNNPEFPTVFERQWSSQFSLTPINGEFALSFPLNGIYSLRQWGDVPADAGFLEIAPLRRELFPLQLNDVTVSAEGNPLQWVFDDYPAFKRFDISDYAGKNIELRIDISVSDRVRVLDGVAFVIPEPGIVSLLGVGAGIFAIVRIRFRQDGAKFNASKATILS